MFTLINGAKTAQTIEILSGRLTRVGLRNRILDGSQDRTNLLASVRGDKSAMRPFAILLWTLVIIIIHSEQDLVSLSKNVAEAFDGLTALSVFSMLILNAVVLAA